MNKKLAFITSLIMMVTALFGAGCGEETKTVPYYENNKVMHIGVFTPPEPTREAYQMMADAGFNYVYQPAIDGNLESLAQDELLKMCEDIGLDIMLFTNNWPGHYDRVTVTDHFKNFPAVVGMNFYDEPQKEHFSYIADYVDDFEKHYPDLTFGVNLFPYYAGVTTLGFDSYEEYIDTFCDEVLSKVNGKKQLSVDFYPLMHRAGKNYLASSWFRNLEVIANKAKEINADTHFFIQGTAYGSSNRSPSEEDLRFQFYVNMAYGIRNFSYYTYQTWSPDSGVFMEGQTALVDLNGNKTERWTYAQTVNKEILNFDHIYLSYNWQDTMAILGTENEDEYNLNFDNLKDNNTSLPGINSCSATQDTLIGYFLDDESNKGYIVTNATDPSDDLFDTVTINFKDATHALVYKRGQRVIEELKNNQLTINLQAGQGVFVIPV